MRAAFVIALAATLAGAAAQAEPIVQVDLAKPPIAMPVATDAVIVLRAHAPGMVGDNRISFYRWDAAKAAVEREADGKFREVRFTYSYGLFGGKKGERVLRVAIVPPGDYVLGSRTFNLTYTDSFCFGAPRFSVKAGETVYVGDYEMFALAKMTDGERRNAMRPSLETEETRAALRAVYPALADAMIPWQPNNGTVFDCIGDEFTAFAIPAR